MNREALELYLEGKDPKEIAGIVNGKYGTHFSNVQIRDKIRYYPEYHEFNARRRAAEPPAGPSEIPLQDLLIKSLKRNTKPLSDLARGLKISPRVLQAQLDDLKDQGIMIDEFDSVPTLRTTVVREENHHRVEWRGEEVLRFGAIGDTHLCNKYQQLTHLNTFYDICAREGIGTIYHAGDISDGFYKNRPDHIYELFRIGADEQAQYIIDNYPRRDGVTTHLVTGNHDDTHIKNGGCNIGPRIAREREDMIYLGLSNARIELTPNCILEVNHPGDGSAYALSYSIQKLIDSMSGGEKPKILLNGHHHKAFQLPVYRNIHSLEVGCFEAQTGFMRGKKLAAHIGGWICEARVDESGTVHRFKAEFVAFHVPLKDDF